MPSFLLPVCQTYLLKSHVLKSPHLYLTYPLATLLLLQWIHAFLLGFNSRSQPVHDNLSSNNICRLKELYKLLVKAMHENRLASEQLASLSSLGDISRPAGFAPDLLLILESPLLVQEMVQLRGKMGECLVDILQEVSDALDFNLDHLDHHSVAINLRKYILKILVALAQRIEAFPKSIVFTSMNMNIMVPVDGSARSNIYRVKENSMALKEPRVFMEPGHRLNDFRSEILLMRNLHHPNILEVYGVAYVPWSKNPLLATPWMVNGTVLSFLCTRRHDAGRILLQVSRAIAYLHAHGVVHANLRGENILVDEDGNARVADFGRATFFDSVLSWTGPPYKLKEAHWTAPELLAPEKFKRAADDYHPTANTDVYSFACLCWELHTLRVPFSSDVPVIVQLIINVRPERPTAAHGDVGMSDALWTLLQRCWSKDAMARPSIEEWVDDLARD